MFVANASVDLNMKPFLDWSFAGSTFEAKRSAQKPHSAQHSDQQGCADHAP
jgi:hypothetical protein